MNEFLTFIFGVIIGILAIVGILAALIHNLERPDEDRYYDPTSTEPIFKHFNK